MSQILGPNQGFCKPTTRPGRLLRYASMAKGKTRRKKTPSLFLRAVIAANVSARAKIQFPNSDNLPVDIAKASEGAATNKLIKSTVQRIMSGETSATLEQLDGLAFALDLQQYQLLMPNLDAKNPQVAAGALPGEDRAYATDIKHHIREGVREALADFSQPQKPKK